MTTIGDVTTLIYPKDDFNHPLLSHEFEATLYINENAVCREIIIADCCIYREPIIRKPHTHFRYRTSLLI